MKKVVFIVFALLNTFQNLYAQNTEDKIKNIKKLQAEVAKRDSLNSIRIKEFEVNNSELKNILQANGIKLKGFDELGHPKFIGLDNTGAARTTGVTQLQTNGNLGINLQGEGITIGVWDEGIVPPHEDFQNRILSSEGANLAVHATHVTGTIIGSGAINPAARGMAPKAKAYTFDFNNDEAEMLLFTKPDQSTLLFSNHSYGLITGWRFNNGSWTWFGNASISNAEDYRFGFYDSDSKLWDEILYNSPYYSVVKSAGNDRSDSGSGAFPADCNGGTGFDCLGNIAVVKNLLTIGAVNKLSEYNGPSSVVMSSFSSWGPTDDGRIKPDLVAAGVGVFSTSATNNTAYTVLSGTSMATPNTTGSLILLQELKKKVDAEFMKAATLKALAIHTTKEAGVADGPDYVYGWGLLDVEEAAKVILNSNGFTNIIDERQLLNNATFNQQISAKANSKIKVTIAWTDPAGQPASASLDPTLKMLVNDLDIKITDSQNNSYLPWCLDPTNLTRNAFKGINSLDNVEKIEMIAPVNDIYTISINHKASLRNGLQDFSIIISYSPIENPISNLFWIGGSNVFQTDQNWANSPNGVAIAKSPIASDNIYFTDYSLGSQSLVTLTSNASVKSLNVLSDSELTIDLNGHTLQIQDKLVLGKKSKIINGTVILLSNENTVNKIIAETSKLEQVDFYVHPDNKANWLIAGELELNKITLSGGTITLPANKTTTVREIEANSQSTQSKLILSASRIEGLEELDFSEFQGTVATNRNTYILVNSESNEKSVNTKALPLLGTIEFRSGSTSINSELKINRINISGSLGIKDNISVDTLSVNGTASISIQDASTISLKSFLQNSISETNQVSLSSEGQATIVLSTRSIVCLENLQISNVDLVTESLITLNPQNSTLENSDGWILRSCNDVALANFEVNAPCIGGILLLEPQESNNIEEYEWQIDGVIYTEKQPFIKIENSGEKSIQLKITTSSGFVNTFTREVEVKSNTIPNFSILYSNEKLVSTRSSSSYIWLNNNSILADKTTRDILPDSPGVYQVLIRDNTCNKLSTEFIITNVIETISDKPNRSFIWPNPFTDKIYISTEGIPEIKSITLTTIEGKKMVSLNGNQINQSSFIDTSQLLQGLYLIKVEYRNNIQEIFRVIK